MRIGVPKEIKTHEYRVGLTPPSVRELVAHGHQVLVQNGAGVGIGCDDEEYAAAGATIVADAAAVFAEAEMIVKVKEPLPDEIARCCATGSCCSPTCTSRRTRTLTRGLLAVGLHRDRLRDRSPTRAARLPLLTPMSEVAGRMAVQVGAHCLREGAAAAAASCSAACRASPPAHVVILGGGVVGTNAAQMAVGLGADVTVLDRSSTALRYLDDMLRRPRATPLCSTRDAIERAVLGGRPRDRRRAGPRRSGAEAGDART